MRAAYALGAGCVALSFLFFLSKELSRAEFVRSRASLNFKDFKDFTESKSECECSSKKVFFRPIDRLSKHIVDETAAAEYGLALVNSEKKADVIFASEDKDFRDDLELVRAVILLHRSDSTTHGLYPILDHPNVLAMFREFTMRSADYSVPLYHGKYHYFLTTQRL